MGYNFVNRPFLLLIFLIFNMLHLAKSQTNCTMVRDIFANASSEFTWCAIYNSRPITLCENCINPYINLMESYHNLEKFSDNETLCIDKFQHLDRLEIVESLYANSQNLWNKAKCYECFEIINGTLTANKSEETRVFNKYYNNLMGCVNRTDINDTTICPTCMKDYLVLSDYYVSISNQNENIGVCMDIVDLMNTTRQFWSDKCCKYRKHDEYVFIISACSVIFTTFLFYASTKIFSERKVPAILQQSRFAESLSQSTH